MECVVDSCRVFVECREKSVAEHSKMEQGVSGIVAECLQGLRRVPQCVRRMSQSMAECEESATGHSQIVAPCKQSAASCERNVAVYCRM